MKKSLLAALCLLLALSCSCSARGKSALSAPDWANGTLLITAYGEEGENKSDYLRRKYVCAFDFDSGVVSAVEIPNAAVLTKDYGSGEPILYWKGQLGMRYGDRFLSCRYDRLPYSADETRSYAAPSLYRVSQLSESRNEVCYIRYSPNDRGDMNWQLVVKGDSVIREYITVLDTFAYNRGEPRVRVEMNAGGDVVWKDLNEKIAGQKVALYLQSTGETKFIPIDGARWFDWIAEDRLLYLTWEQDALQLMCYSVATGQSAQWESWDAERLAGFGLPAQISLRADGAILAMENNGEIALVSLESGEVYQFSPYTDTDDEAFRVVRTRAMEGGTVIYDYTDWEEDGMQYFDMQSSEMVWDAASAGNAGE